MSQLDKEHFDQKLLASGFVKDAEKCKSKVNDVKAKIQELNKKLSEYT